jgi:predicted patatin/cPLA2 family phospholipase
VNGLIDVLLARAARGSRAPHDDGASIALVVEGGAMRGVISAGMVSALEDLHMTHAFDAIYGASAGSINAAYFLAGQATLGTSIYYEDINNASFIDLKRGLRGGSIVDLSYLLDDVAVRRKKLETARVLDSTTPLAVLATDVDTREAAALTDFDSAADLMGALRAGATMPVIAGAPHELRGRRYLDASLSEPIPVPSAEEAGHTHVLALLTRGAGMRPRPSAFDRFYVGPRLKRLSPDLAARYMTRAVPYAEICRQIDAGTGPRGLARVQAVRVSDYPISRLERRRPVLVEGARRGYDAVMATFGRL